MEQQTITYHFVGIPTYFTCKATDLDKQVNQMKRKLSLSYDHEIIIVQENKEKENGTTTTDLIDNPDAGVSNSDNQEIPALPVEPKKDKSKRK